MAARNTQSKSGRGARRTAPKKAVRRKPRRTKNKGLTFESEIILWILLGVSILLFASNFGFGGKIGNGASALIFGLFGCMAYLFPILLFLSSCFLISNRRNHFAIFKFIAGILLFCAICMFAQLIVTDGDAANQNLIA